MLYIIGGPTASGKTSLALKLAEKVNGEIINGDSLQLYRNIPVLSVAPSKEDLQKIPHHLFGIYDDEVLSTVYGWLNFAKEVIRTITNQGKTPIVVGGTGMYLKALTHGISKIPTISEHVRDKVRSLQKVLDKQNFYQYVLEKDPKIKETLHFNDSQRLARALEVILETGRSIRDFQHKSYPIINDTTKTIILCPNREELYQKINGRSITIIDQGAIEEVKNLQEKGLNLDAPICKAIGIKEIWGYLEGKYDKDHMLSIFQQATRNYAKRQVTWFKNQIHEATIIENSFDTRAITELV